METKEQQPIPFALPDIGREEEEAVLRVLRSGWLTTGKEAISFEKEFAEAVSAHSALAVNSATAGLHLAAEALGVCPGDKVVTTPFTFTSTAEILRYLGADPIFADIDEETLTIDPRCVAEILDREPKIKGVIPVHLGGRMAEMDRIVSEAKKRGLFVIEDAAHAFPLSYKGKAAGTIGDAGVFSFYATKTITTGEGGMVVTDNEALAKRMSVMRLHGIDRDVWDRYSSSKGSWRYAVVAAGYKYNLTDLAAAIGRVQLKRAQEFKERRCRIASYYEAELGGIEALKLPKPPGRKEDHAWHLFIVRLRPGYSAIDRDGMVEALKARGIGTSVHYIALHLMPYYRSRYNLSPEQFPVATAVSNSCFSLPIYPSMSDGQVERVVEAIKELLSPNRRRTQTQ
ncbi:DegT/DnrJ/EryC1/StrS family aminotransferase [Sediminispirochaeta smaragdinae]|uniref:DegT/DnrJ/EryC1/StrS aminotransferase n=1 Tax=Sediminispirochaeta smaragdinae (strain DSM 11293 / JCM 15392 / SEBR 4228) TaxID=573413 RepID=E1R436_SEDSS|nr:DegT/DnrJ/EryC1/StrS family aminotransferase [Sediminispirochaeta smaragdinae]ADK80458.1 DegT/DnrJ/EryC1/StrS aminotransferase [Sediminispirochaeta smaragdinae DSM 11293]